MHGELVRPEGKAEHELHNLDRSDDGSEDTEALVEVGDEVVGIPEWQSTGCLRGTHIRMWTNELVTGPV